MTQNLDEIHELALLINELINGDRYNWLILGTERYCEMVRVANALADAAYK